MDDDYLHHGREPSKGRRGPSDSQAAAARVRQAAAAVQAHMLKQLKQAEDAGMNATSSSAEQKPQYPYDRTSVERPASEPAQSGVHKVAARNGNTLLDQLKQAARVCWLNSKQWNRAGYADVCNGLKCIELTHAMVQDVQPPGTARAAAQREQEARWLREMFQAVWPDLGSFKSWTTATKVASMSGSLSLSVAFFGLVYYLSTSYDRAKHEQEPSQGRD